MVTSSLLSLPPGKMSSEQLLSKHPDPIFEGQTKTKLASADATKAVFSVTGDELQLYFDRNLEVLKAIIACAEKSAKIRKAEERAKTNMLTKSRFSFDSNGKLANCESREAEKCEIFIVEGDSAGGSAKMGRNRRYQAILPIRGKILNVQGRAPFVSADTGDLGAAGLHKSHARYPYG